MKLNIFCLILLMTFIITSVFAQPGPWIFRDIISPYTTFERVNSEDPNYGFRPNPPESERWLIQLYKDGGDNIISPLDSLGNPTGDDVKITDPLNQNSTQFLEFLDSSGRMTMLNIMFYPYTSQACMGDKIYLRVFNAHLLSDATKYFQFQYLYIVPSSGSTVEVDINCGWTDWIAFRFMFNVEVTSEPSDSDIYVNDTDSGFNTPHTFNIIPGTNATYSVHRNQYSFSPLTFEVNNIANDTSQNFSGIPNLPHYAILNLPANGSEGFNVDGLSLRWAPYNADDIIEGYKIFMGTANPPLEMIADVSDTTIYTGVLPVPGTYYWKVVPYNSGGDALNCPVWSFSAEVYPPLANFSVDITEQLEPLIAHFTDLSSAGSGVFTTWFWDFGDGITSTEQNPVHTYTDDGIYDVSLSVSNSYSAEDDTVRTELIHVLPRFPVIQLVVGSTLDFGQVYLEHQSDTLIVSIVNIGTSPLVINGVYFNNPNSEFTILDSLIGNSIDIGNSANFRVALLPRRLGVFNDTLIIENNSINSSLISIPLSAICDYIPLKRPESTSIIVNNDNAIISWLPVNETIFDQPLLPDGYLVFYSEDNINFYYLWETTTTSFNHQRVARFRTQMFYNIVAYKFNSRVQQERMQVLLKKSQKIKMEDFLSFLKR